MVIPLTIGVAVDYALNIAIRLVRNREHSLAHILQHSGKAVALCSTTTLISYFTLTRANNLALASFGKAAVIGELTCLFSALILVPALFSWRRKHL